MASSASGQHAANSVFWLATREGKMGRYCPLGIARFVSAIKVQAGALNFWKRENWKYQRKWKQRKQKCWWISRTHFETKTVNNKSKITKRHEDMELNKSFINQASLVKLAGYWPSALFACLWTETKSRSIETQKEKHLDLALWIVC